MVPTFPTSQRWGASTCKESPSTAQPGRPIYSDHRHSPQYSIGWNFRTKITILNRKQSCYNLHCHCPRILACFQSTTDNKRTCNAKNSRVWWATCRPLLLKRHNQILSFNFEQFWRPTSLFFGTKKALRVGEMLEGT